MLVDHITSGFFVTAGTNKCLRTQRYFRPVIKADYFKKHFQENETGTEFKLRQRKRENENNSFLLLFPPHLILFLQSVYVLSDNMNNQASKVFI